MMNSNRYTFQISIAMFRISINTIKSQADILSRLQVFWQLAPAHMNKMPTIIP